ncbi:MAG: class I SAM-dependent methyltransferase [Pseudomonadota bacterium]
MGVAPCKLCETDQSEIVSIEDRKGEALETRVCLGCGQVFNNPVPSDVELTQFYSEDYRKEYKGAARPRGRQIIRNFRRTASHLKRFSDVLEGRNRVLDVGAGSGEFLFALTQMGKITHGFEPNQDYSAYCREDLGLDVQTNQIDGLKPASTGYDPIHLSHVLEHLNAPVRHLNAPVRHLEKLASWLVPQGVLYVEVPNVFEYSARKSNGKMFHYGHIFNYSPWTLGAAACRAGLTELDATKDRCSDTTGCFFVRTDDMLDPTACLNAENVKLVSGAIGDHCSGQVESQRDGAIVRLARKLTVRVNESIAARRESTPQDIGRSVLSSANLI